MSKFNLKSDFKPTADQEQAICNITKNINNNIKNQVLRGVTGSGKTFTIANVIERTQRPTLVISHNKTLAAQLYQEYRDFFPDSAVSYFVSYYDYYQPEAYIPSTDTYIEKDAGINEVIDKLRLQTTANLLTRKDVIVVASVSCIYNIGSPKEYQNFTYAFAEGTNVSREDVLAKLVDLQYTRSDFGFHRGTFRVRGDTISIYPSYMDDGVQFDLTKNKIKNLSIINTKTGETIEHLKSFMLFPGKHFITDNKNNEKVFKEIKTDLENQIDYFKKAGKDLEAHRIKQKVTYEMEMLKEIGYVKGIENYSRYFDGRKPGDAPNSLLGYFNEAYGDDWLVVVDESHIAFPQIGGMHAGDFARTKTLVDYGFRLPAALDNRPLKFDEFMRRIPGFIATSATPKDWELSMAPDGLSEQLLRPTGIPDPKVDIRPVSTQVKDCTEEIRKRAKLGQRCLVTTLTKRTAEDLSVYLTEQGLKVQYLHSGVKTLERTDILNDLRLGNYDAIVGINLLREGIDLPEVSLVAILDADKEGFLRSDTALVQTMGRAARHVDGFVILYADKITGSMDRALNEVRRRRKYQIAQNKKMGIIPTSIIKPIKSRLAKLKEEKVKHTLPDIDAESLTPSDKTRLSKTLRKEMRLAANDLNFELAIEIRDKLRELED